MWCLSAKKRVEQLEKRVKHGGGEGESEEETVRANGFEGRGEMKAAKPHHQK